MIKPIRSLFEALSLMHRGEFAERVDEHLAKAIAEVERSQDDKASATITLKVAIQRVGDRIEIKPAIDSALPKEKGFQSIPFWIVDGALSVQHPSQTDMFARPRDVDSDRRFEQQR